MHHLTIMGHLGTDPEARFTSSGQKLTTFRVATNQRRSGKGETLWWRVTVWGEQFDKLMPYWKKGSAIIVVGEMLKPEIYTDREGQPQLSLNIVAHHLSFSPFGRKDSNNQMDLQSSGDEPLASSSQKGEQQYEPLEQEKEAFSEDEIPF